MSDPRHKKYELLTKLLTRIKREYELDALAFVALPRADSEEPLMTIFNNIIPGEEANFLQTAAEQIRDKAPNFHLAEVSRSKKDN
jgi:hypothetical protein